MSTRRKYTVKERKAFGEGARAARAAMHPTHMSGYGNYYTGFGAYHPRPYGSYHRATPRRVMYRR